MNENTPAEQRPAPEPSQHVAVSGSGRPPSTRDSELGTIDLSEKGRSATGQPLSLNRRLFMQFMAIRYVTTAGLVAHFKDTNAAAVIYQDLNDPHGIGLLLFHEDPDYFVGTMQRLILLPEMVQAEFKDEFTMLGRTYSLGYEDNLEDVLLHRSAQRVCDPATPWAVWYPVRRSGRFEQESREEQRRMLMEHGGIGHAYGKAGFATDIRLAAHGLNRDDNDFIVGLIGKDLFPLSALVQHMRRTKQTSEFIQHMGPFFVGRVIWQSQSP